MAANREACFAALATRLTGLPGVVTFSRTFLGWDDESAVEKPAVFLTKGGESARSAADGVLVWRLEATVIVTVRVREADPAVAPSTILNEIITAVEERLERQPLEGPAVGARFMENPDRSAGTSLGGVCRECKIEGEIVTDEGGLGLDGIAVIPIAMYTTG